MFYYLTCQAPHPLRHLPNFSDRPNHNMRLGVARVPLEPTGRTFTYAADALLEQALRKVAPGCEGLVCTRCKTVSEFRLPAPEEPAGEAEG